VIHNPSLLCFNFYIGVGPMCHPNHLALSSSSSAYRTDDSSPSASAHASTRAPGRLRPWSPGRVHSRHDQGPDAVTEFSPHPDPFAADAAAIDTGDDNGPGNAPLEGGGYTSMDLAPLDGGGYTGMVLTPLGSSNPAASLSRSALILLVLATAANWIPNPVSPARRNTTPAPPHLPISASLASLLPRRCHSGTTIERISTTTHMLCCRMQVTLLAVDP
jgi:hypothetical protein